jgi:Na+-transporting methylmalonyl-CoA/oxaloacetate decarboxylase gamma subunit
LVIFFISCLYGKNYLPYGLGCKQWLPETAGSLITEYADYDILQLREKKLNLIQMKNNKMLLWLTGHKLIICGIVVVVLVLLLLASQTPTIISATVSPEVIVKGQNQEVTVTVTVKPWLFIAPRLKAVMAERGYNGSPKTQNDWVKFFSEFNLNPKTLGSLINTGKDGQGNMVYNGTFTINSPTTQTVQIQPTNMFGINLLPQSTPSSARLAITTHPATLPPYPGEAGKETLAGIDSDHDGLRDDVQREIMFLAPQSEKLRMALGQYAKAEQVFASQANLDKKQNYDSVEKSFDGLSCVEVVNPTTEQSLHVNYALETILGYTIQNTSERKKVYEKNDSQAVGHFTGLDDIKRCSFNPAGYAD